MNDTSSANSTVTAYHPPATLNSAWLYQCPELSTLNNQLISVANSINGSDQTNITATSVQQQLSTCIYKRSVEIVTFYNQFDTYQSLFFGCTGLIGSIFSLITLMTHTSSFNAPTFRYFRVLAVLQSWVMISFIYSAARRIFGNFDKFSYFWTFVSVYFEKTIMDVFGNWADWIICFLSLERSVACLAPRQFKKFHSRVVFYTVLGVTLCLACVSDLTTAFTFVITCDQKIGTCKYSQIINDLYFNVQSYMRTVFITVKCALIVLLTMTAIIGFCVAHRKKINLQNALKTHESDPGTADKEAEQRRRSELKSSLQLCLLQFAQAFPTALCAAVFTAAVFNIFAPFSGDMNYANLIATNDENIYAYIRFVQRYWGIIGLFQAIRAFGHCTHFYFYILFSKRFRWAVWKSLKNANRRIWPINNNQNEEITNMAINSTMRSSIVESKTRRHRRMSRVITTVD